VAVSKGELAAAEENDDRLDPGILVGGFMFDSGVEGTGVLADVPACKGNELSGSSEASVMTDPASDAVDALLPMDGRSALNEGGRELRISMFICDPARPARSRTKGLTVKALLRWLTE